MRLTRKETDYIYDEILENPSVSKEEYNETVNSMHSKQEYTYASIKTFTEFIKDENNEKGE